MILDIPLKIAVLIPSYMPSKYLERCLYALNRQSIGVSAFKVYFALNGPKAGFEEYCLSVLSKCSFQYEYVYLEEAGVSLARNKLIDMSTEKYIAFLDDDDMVSEHYLEQLLKSSVSGFLSVSNVLNFKDDLRCLSANYIGRSYEGSSEISCSLFKSRKFFNTPWGKLISREIIGPVRFDSKLCIGEDSLFMAQLSKRVRGVIKSDNSACYFVFQRSGSASRKKVPRGKEIRRISYLVLVYMGMLFRGYNIPFVLSRVLATLAHLKRVVYL